MADYTKLNQTDIETLLDRYDLGPLEAAAPLSGGQANSSYQLTTPKGYFTLSVCDEKTAKETRVLTRVLEALASHGFPTTHLVPARDGRAFVTFREKPVYIKTYLDGEVSRDLDPAMLAQVGQAMARLHTLPAPDGLPPAFPYGLAYFNEVLDTEISHPFKEWLSGKKAYMEATLDLSMARGFIHGDIFWDNLLFDRGNLVAVLDFEEACQYFFLYDLGMAAVGCCSSDGSFDRDKVSRLVRGYQARRPLSGKEKGQFTPFLVYAATAAAFWRFRQYNIRRPDPARADTYQELAALADQAAGLGPNAWGM